MVLGISPLATVKKQSGSYGMKATMARGVAIPWWKEPTKEQWLAWVAAWLGWTLDAFDFTIFLLIMVPISQSFGVPLIAVTAVFTITLWLRLVGAVGSGWLADRMGRKKPLMISVLWYSICNLLAGISPTFFLLFLFRALLGIGMGAEWPAGAALAMESWPARSRGFMSGILQGSWSLGFLLSSLVYLFLYTWIGWRGLLMLGILPALAVVWIRSYIKEPEVWTENRRIQRETNKEFRAPLLDIFRPAVLLNTITACLWMASSFIVYYSVYGMFATHLQKDLHFTPAYVAMPIALANLVAFSGNGLWGVVADIYGRRWAMIIPAAIGIFITPLYLFVHDYSVIAGAFIVQGMFLGAIYGQNPSYLSERFPTEVRATASGFCYHQGAVWAGFTAPVLAYFAAGQPLGFAVPMMLSTTGAAVVFIFSLVIGPETRGKVLVAEITLPVEA
jgi:MFS transporter, SHS family, lactate transporter